jgi:hypothetical protein
MTRLEKATLYLEELFKQEVPAVISVFDEVTKELELVVSEVDPGDKDSSFYVTWTVFPIDKPEGITVVTRIGGKSVEAQDMIPKHRRHLRLDIAFEYAIKRLGIMVSEYKETA